MTGALARLEQREGMPELVKAEQLLARVETLPEVKDLIASADALRLFMRKADLGYANQNRAAAIGIRARRKAGEIAKAIERRIGGRPAKTRQSDLTSSTPLQEACEKAGVTRETMNQWQTLAEHTTEADIDEAARRATEERRELTTADVMPRSEKLRRVMEEATHSSSSVSVVLDESLARIRSLPAPEEIARTMPAGMRHTVDLRVVAEMIGWLERFRRAWKEVTQ